MTMTMIKDDTFVITNTLKVAFYCLNKPFDERTLRLDEKGMILGGKIDLKLEIDPEAQGSKELLDFIEGVDVKDQEDENGVKTGNKLFKVSTAFVPNVYDAEGKEIEAPSMFKGDIMHVQVSAKLYKGKNKKTKKPYSVLNLNSVKIISHDTSNRVEREMTGGAAQFVEATAAANAKLNA